MTEYVFFSDVEGPLANPGQDNAKDILAFMESKGLITPQERSDIEGPADNADDNRHRREKFLHLKRNRWSTGTTPGTVQCYAAMRGLTDADIYEIAMDKFLLNDGLKELLEFVNQRCAKVGLGTTAHPSVSLTIGKDHGILSSNIWSLGYRPSPERLREFDEHPDVLAEIKDRSIICSIAPYRDAYLEKFMSKFVRNNVEWDKAYNQEDTGALSRLDGELQRLFLEERDLGTFLDRMDDILLSKRVLMGAHQKGQVVFQLSKYGVPIVVGDSIVDDLMLLYAQALGGVGIAVNDTNPDSLLCAAISMATPNMQAVRDVVELIITNRYDTDRANQIVAKYGANVFSLYDYRNDPKRVVDAHKQTKSHLKARYKEWLESKTTR